MGTYSGGTVRGEEPVLRNVRGGTGLQGLVPRGTEGCAGFRAPVGGRFERILAEARPR